MAYLQHYRDNYHSQVFAKLIQMQKRYSISLEEISILT